MHRRAESLITRHVRTRGKTNEICQTLYQGPVYGTSLPSTRALLRISFFIVLQTRRVYLPDTQVREPCFASVCTVPPVEKRAVRWRQGEAEEGEEGGGKQGVARPSGEGSYCRMSRLSGAGEGEVVSKDVGEEKRGARGADRRSDNAISVSFSLSLARSTA